MVTVQRAPVKNLSQINVNDVIYLVGDDVDDDSIRFSKEATGDTGNLELKTDGVWNDDGIRFSYLRLNRDMVLSSVAGFVQTSNPSSVTGHEKGLIPHIEFGDDGTDQVIAPSVNAQETFVVYTGEVSEEVATSIGISISVTTSRMVDQSIHEVGTTAATDDVTVSSYVGTDNTGILFNQRILPASDMPANTQLVIEYGNDLAFEAGTDIFVEFTSDQVMSLKTDTNGDPLTTHIGREIGQLFMVTENLYYDKDKNPMLDNNMNPYYSSQF